MPVPALGRRLEISWKVTRPEFSKGDKTPGQELFARGRIDVPFFCHDVTSFTGRVPSQYQDKTTHPCSANSIAACGILMLKDQQAGYSNIFSKIVSIRLAVAVRAAESEGGIKRMQERGIGLYDLVCAVKSKGPGGEAERPLGSSAIESMIWLEKSKE